MLFLFLNNWCEDNDDDYGEYIYDDYPDDCDFEKTVYDSPSDDTCQHDDFTKIPKVNKLSEYSNTTIFQPCCEMEPSTKHGYLYQDQCEVYIVKSFYNLNPIYRISAALEINDDLIDLSTCYFTEKRYACWRSSKSFRLPSFRLWCS